MKKLLSGNETITLGAYHASTVVSRAYSRIPNTKIVEINAKAFEPKESSNGNL